MSDYSGYIRGRPRALGPFTSVYEATAPGGGPGKFALKIFHPPASTQVRRAYDLEGWLLAAERQQIAFKKDGAVLEILAFGRCEEGAYTVTPWQERSLEPLLTTLTPKGDHLRALADSLLNALEQWSAQTGGSHRKLKATNVFLTKPGPLAAAGLVFTDPWFTYGNKTAGGRINDLTAIGGMLAEVVRRRPVTAWPIEEGPEWRALGRAGKAWLAYCNYLLNPQPAAGELTLTEARKRLQKIPKDSNLVRNTLLVGAAAILVFGGGLLAFARFGNPIYMPDNVQQLARALHNPATLNRDIPRSWTLLCRAWDTWLGDVQNNAPRLLKTEALWSGPNDPLKLALADFNNNAKALLPGVVVPQAADEKRLGVLADSPPPAVLSQLQLPSVQETVDLAYRKVQALATRLEQWPRWDELHNLEAMLKTRAFDRAFAALQPKLPMKRDTAGYKLDTPRTLKFFNDVSLDETGTLLLASTWRKISDLKTHMEATPDRIQRQMPELILRRLADRSSLGDFADSLADPLAEMTKYRNEYIDPAVVVERFQNDSALLKETADVTTADFPRWEKELHEYSKVPPADDPRLLPELQVIAGSPPATVAGLENDKPEGDPGNPEPLSKPEFDQEFAGLQANLNTFRAREIVRHDLPAVIEEKGKFTGLFKQLVDRIDYTLTLLQPEIWLGKVAKPYGKFNATRQRWADWYGTLNGVTADALRGPANRPHFRDLRAQERQLRAWIDGLEGPDGLDALKVPELSAASTDTAGALKQLEARRREDTAAAAAKAAEWRNALPVVPWSSATAATRAPLDAHRQWLMDLPSFSVDLDRLSALLEGGFGWDEGVSETMTRLARHAGLDDLQGKPAEWNTEAKLLGRLSGSNDRNELVASAQNGGLSRRFTAWRRLGAITGWPAGAEDLDVDGAVVAALREILGRDVKDETRRATLADELTKETRLRWNRAARNSASDEARLSAVFERMEKYGIGQADLDPPAARALLLWRYKHSDWSEVDLAPLRARRDAFVAAMRAIPGLETQPEMKKFVDELDGITLVVDPNRKPTPSPRLAGWTEELTDNGLGLTATWKSGGKTVKLDFAIVQPVDDSVLPFYLAKRAIAVGDFIDLVDTRPKEAAPMMDELPRYTREDSDTPHDRPLGWWPRIDNTGKYVGFELSPAWIAYPGPIVKGLLNDPGDAGKQAGLDKAAAEKPTLRSPLQMIPPKAAEIFAEKLVGARLPTPVEWRAALKTLAATNQGIFRGPNFQQLFDYLRKWTVAGQITDWRPSAGVFAPPVPTATGGKQKFVDDGQPAPAPRSDGRLWFAPVDEGPVTGPFLNLLGNVSIYLSDGKDAYVAGGSALSSPHIDFTEPKKIEAGGMLIGQKKATEGFSDVGIRPAFDAPPGFRERYKLLVLVRQQKYLTW